MKKAGESGAGDSREANTAGRAFEEAVGKHRLKFLVVHGVQHEILLPSTWYIDDIGPASCHSEPLAEACEQKPHRRREQTGENPFIIIIVEKGKLESFGNNKNLNVD